MSKGYPDFFGQTFLLTYGPTTYEDVQDTIDKDDEGEKFRIEDKGILTGCGVSLWYGDVGAICHVTFKVDGVEIDKSTVPNEIWAGTSKQGNIYHRIVYADYEEQQYVIALTREIVFATSFTIEFDTNTVVATSIHVDAWYRPIFSL